MTKQQISAKRLKKKDFDNKIKSKDSNNIIIKYLIFSFLLNSETLIEVILNDDDFDDWIINHLMQEIVIDKITQEDPLFIVSGFIQ